MKKLFVLSVLALLLASLSVFAASPSVSLSGLNDGKIVMVEEVEELRDETSSSFTITNDNTAEYNVTNLKVEFISAGPINGISVGLCDDGVVCLINDELNATNTQESFKITIDNSIADYEDANLNLGTIKITGNYVNDTTTAFTKNYNLTYQTKSRLAIKDAYEDDSISMSVTRYNDDNEDKDDDEDFGFNSDNEAELPVDIYPFDIVELEFDVANLFDNDEDDWDFNDVTIEYIIEGFENDGDDLEEDDDIEDIDTDDDAPYTIKFEAPYTASEQDFTLKITLTAEDDDDKTHEAYYEITIPYDRNKDEVAVDKLEIFDNSLRCDEEEVEVNFRIINTGNSDIDEDDLEVKIFNNDLGISKVFQPEDELKYDDEDDAVYANTVYMQLPSDIEAGEEYYFDVYVLVDGDIESRERVYFEIEKCEVKDETSNQSEANKPIIQDPITITPEVVDSADVENTDSETVSDNVSKEDGSYMLALALGNVVLLVAVIVLIVVLATGRKN